MACRNGRTKPALWESSKAQAVERLGGRFSARAMQLAGKLYRDAGGGYCGPLTGAQRSLRKWTGERWTTASGARACEGDRCDRYLPAAAWGELTPAQRQATRRKKLAGDSQWVKNTAAAAKAARKARK